MAAPAKVDTLTTGKLPPRNSLMGLPVELRLDIIERVLNEDHLHLFEKSTSGKTMYQIWCGLFPGIKAYFVTWQTVRMFRWGYWSCIDNFDHPANPRQPCVFRPRVHPLLHTNYTLREEGRDLYLKFSKWEMAAYETKHKSMMPMFVDGDIAYKEMKLSGGPQRGIGHAPDYGDYSAGFELAETCIRWYALKKTCELPERHGSCRGSASVRWKSRALNGIRKFQSFKDWVYWLPPREFFRD